MIVDKIPVPAVVGPTASGKTALAVELALRLNGEVISADSMQIYRGMDIATAKPTADEMRGVTHHMLDFLDPGERFSVARYCELVRPLISDIHSRGKLPIIAGGTGLYIDSLLGNVNFFEAETSDDLRAQLQAELEAEGLDHMLDILRSFDPDSAERLAEGRNPKRVLRAIEIYRTTGMTMTHLNALQTDTPSPYDSLKIGLTAEDRAYLYDRIDRRVDMMLDMGLVDEARAFYDGEFGDTAAAAIGYKELLPYLMGDMSLDECVDKLKRSTRRYAKRQLTWFRRDPDTVWFSIDTMSFDDIANEAESLVRQRLF